MSTLPEMALRTTREKVLAAAVAVVVLGALLYVYAIEPTAQQFFEVRDASAGAQQELVELRALLGSSEEIARQARQLNASFAARETGEALEVAFIRQVDEIVHGAGLTLRTLKPLAANFEAQYERHALQVSTQGEHHELIALLQRLQEPGCFVRVDSLNLTANRGTPPITATMTISKLFEREGK